MVFGLALNFYSCKGLKMIDLTNIEKFNMQAARKMKAGDQAIFSDYNDKIQGGNIHLAMTRAGGKCTIETNKQLISLDPIKYVEYTLFTCIEACGEKKKLGRPKKI